MSERKEAMNKKILLLLAVIMLVAAACGGSDDADEGVTSLSGATDDEVIAIPQALGDIIDQTDEEALLGFTACMRENGIDIEDPTVDADGGLEFRFRAGAGPQDGNFDREAAQAARDACSDLLEGVTLGFRRPDLTEVQDNLFEYASCMRENGYDMADPDFSGFPTGGGGGGGGQGGGFVSPFGEIDPNDADFVAANEACSDILAGFGEGGGLRGGGPAGGGRPGGGGNG